MRKLFILVIVLLLVESSCQKGEEETLTHIHNATIKINAYREVSNGSGDVEQIPIDDVLVQIFKTENDRDYDQNEVNEASTNSDGFVAFYNLEEDYYYIKSTHSSFGVRLEEVSTPDNTVSFVDLIY